MSSLVIVESPAKAKTINKILGKDFTVKASVGHIMDLPSKKLGVDVEKDFEAVYEVIPGKEKVIKELKKAAKDADKIYLAPDPDREGEAIAAHIATVVGTAKNRDSIFRVTFNEITKKAVLEAMEKPGKIDTDKVDAQQARRVLDRLVGYNLSPLLWRKIRQGLSAGRVQSVAVRLVVEREREIEAFKKEEYWSIGLKLKGANPPEFKASLFKYDGSLVIDRDAAEEGRRFLITEEARATGIVEALKSGEYTVTAVEMKTRRRMPAPAFITSTLQQEASRKLGFAAKRTMSVAQQLYEGIELGAEGATGLITYMRTDSVRVSEEAVVAARAYITEKFGERYVPAKPPKYKSKASAQEAHEAIRPTHMSKPPEAVASYMSPDQLKLYTLIWNRFMASQMQPAEMEMTTVTIGAGINPEAVVRATGTVITFHGFMALYTEGTEDEDSEEGGILPKLEAGDKLKLSKIEPKQHFTQPPPRYSEASLVKTLEELGIGRPSTYATIMSTIVDREYVTREQKRFMPTELGLIVNDFLVEKFPDLLDAGFTAKMEDRLDRIEEGKSKWDKVIKDFYKPFNAELERAAQSTGKVRPEDIKTEEKCDKCGAEMVIRWGRHGRFMACTAYPECKNTRPLEGERPVVEEQPTEEKCPKCGSDMVIKSGRFGKFMACTKYPECKTTKPIPTGVKCPEDGGDIVEKRTRKGKAFWSCSNYPKCKFATWHRPMPEPCPKCGGTYTVIKKDANKETVRACENKDCDFSEVLKQ